MTKLAVAVVALLLPAWRSDAQDMPKPQKEHEWLQQLVGEWEIEGEIAGEAGQPPTKTKGSASSRRIGGFWLLSEHKGDFFGTPFSGIFTLGYSPEKKKYVATWVDSVSSHLWSYQGSVDAAGKVLTLETEGPGMDGKSAKYRETSEIKDKDHLTYTSSIEKDGTSVTFLTMKYTRKK
jgi:hypothetical protein